jgi:hypothetical protein
VRGERQNFGEFWFGDAAERLTAYICTSLIGVFIYAKDNYGSTQFFDALGFEQKAPAHRLMSYRLPSQACIFPDPSKPTQSCGPKHWRQ